MKRSVTLFLLWFFVVQVCAVQAQITADSAVKLIKRGINLGNTFDAPSETAWGNPVSQSYFFDDYKSAGFNCIRVPVTWYTHVLYKPPYTINPTWLARVDTVISWGLKRGLFIILNAHHETWLKSAAGNPDTVARFDSIWSQISVHFQKYSDHLIFEVLNEPYPMSEDSVNIINSDIYNIIRKTNPTRLINYSGYMWSDVAQLVTAKIPNPNDPYLIGYYHSYDPYNFCGSGIGTYGSASDVNSTIGLFQQVTSWSEINLVPVVLDEMGAEQECAYNPRMFYYATVVEQALRYKVPFNAWDDGGDFQIYLRIKRQWNDIKDILVHFNSNSPTNLAIQNMGSSILLTWENRANYTDSIYIDRKTNATDTFIHFKTLSGSSVSFNDSTIENRYNYYYRLRTLLNDTFLYSYPITLEAVVTETRDVTLPQQIILSPNPAKSFVVIKNNTGSATQLDVFSMQGSDVMKKKLIGEINNISLAGISDGVYLFRIISINGIQTEKVVITH